MNFSLLKGNARIKRILRKPFHAYIIEGETGSGRHTLMRLILQAAVCTAQSAERPCGNCVQCRKFSSGNHPDVTYISPDIKTEGLRRILADVYYKPNEAEKRCFAIDGAEKLSVQNQNILLKTLEEPPEYAMFVLLCDSAESLLETVRSRCMTLTMQPLSDREIQSALSDRKYSGCSEEKKREATAFCDGYIGKAEQILFGSAADEYELCGQFLQALIGSDHVRMLDICCFKKRDELADFIYALRRYIAIHLHRQAAFDEQVSGMGEERLISLYSRLGKIQKATETNINATLWSTHTVRDCLAAYALKM